MDPELQGPWHGQQLLLGQAKARRLRGSALRSDYLDYFLLESIGTSSWAILGLNVEFRRVAYP